MIIGSRQAKFGAVCVPEINRCEAEIKFSKKWFSIKTALVKVLDKKYGDDYFSKGIEDSVTQTLNFLIEIGATKEPGKEVNSIRLWKKWIKLSPIYEGINMQLNTMLIKYHYPSIYKKMSDNSKPIEHRVYSHWGLTVIKECALYTIEFLEKNNLLIDHTEFVKMKSVVKWFDDAIEKIEDGDNNGD